MVEERKTAPIIITKKRKKAHAAHHGGAWKVAYADFVTAMMAFFLVMWLVGQSDAVKQSVSGYFRDPVAFGEGAGVLEGGEAAVPVQPTAAEAEQQQALEQARREAEEAVRNQLAQAGQAIQKLLDESPELQSLRDQIEIEMTDEGLRIQMIEPGDGEAFFKSGSAELNPRTENILAVVASELKRLSNHIVVEGHTDDKQFASDSRYTNWELSADRANSARAELEMAGLPAGQIREIRGYAANKPKIRHDPSDPRNRRISILVLNDFGHTVQRRITVGDKSFVYKDGEGYREQFDNLTGRTHERGQGE
jgi:chemotaxis protein MotB